MFTYLETPKRVHYDWLTAAAPQFGSLHPWPSVLPDFQLRRWGEPNGFEATYSALRAPDTRFTSITLLGSAARRSARGVSHDTDILGPPKAREGILGGTKRLTLLTRDIESPHPWPSPPG